MKKIIDYLILFIRIILPCIALIIYYCFLLIPTLDDFYQVRMNNIYIAILIFGLSSIQGIILSALYKKNYDIFYLIFFKILSFFSCSFILAVEDLIYQKHSILINFDLLKGALNIVKNSFLTIGPEGFLNSVMTTLSFLLLYFLISIIPFILVRIIKKNILIIYKV
jgi:hypothetical protein